jgi:formylglycine-generating enzyme required for sulfatase activity
MADIFLSYAREDEPRARLLAAALESHGWSVWWDRRIPHGKDFSAYIQQQLDAAHCIVVLWSKASLASQFVRDEAEEGRSDGRLVPLLLEAVKQPLGFRQLHAADLSDWHAGGTHDEFDRLVAAISAIIPPTPAVSTAQPPPVSPSAQPSVVVPTPPVPLPPTERSGARKTNLANVGRETDTNRPVRTLRDRLARRMRWTIGNPLRGVFSAAVVLSIVAFAIVFWLRLKPSVEPGSLEQASQAPPSRGANTASSSPARETPPLNSPNAAASRGTRVTSPPSERAEPTRPTTLGSTNASGAHSRFNASAWNLPSEDLLGFVEIPAGPFTMGSDKSKDDQAHDDELPQHQVTLPAFFMGRYEVTVGQFKACVSDGGCTAGDRKALDGTDDLPVGYVSWHEALAYCGWLEGKMRSWNRAPSAIADALGGRRDRRAWHVTLPSEAEWERAARGTDGRIYPWGDRIDPTKANYDDAKRGPTPVGSFPAGASPEGLLDMSGNVWEWTRSHNKSYPYRPDDGRENLKAGDDVLRVMRGGAFYNVRRDVRAACRVGSTPDGRSDDFGFRVVVSPFSSGL